MKTKGKNRKVEKKSNFEKKKKEKLKKKKKTLWITIVIQSTFECGGTVILPYHLEYVIIYIYVYKKLYS